MTPHLLVFVQGTQGVSCGCVKFGHNSLCTLCVQQCVLRTILNLASSPGLRGEGKGRPGTHCMRMRHYSPDFGESGYVRILSVYLHRKLHVFKVMMSVSHIDATRTQPACPHGKRWVWLAILCPSLRRR